MEDNINENSNDDDSLKSPLILSAQQIESYNVPENLAGLFRQQYYRLGFGISKWYNKLSGNTIPSSFVALQEADANSLLAFCELCKQTDNETVEYDFTFKKLDDTSQQHIAQLKLKIDEAIGPWKETGAFVKLDSRSPKDAVDGISSDFMKSLVLHEVKTELTNNSLKTRSQAILDGFMKAQYKALKVHSAKEALLLLGKSSRVLEDLTNTLPLMPYNFPLCIVIREWNHEMVETPEREFRGFVYQNQLTAVSQVTLCSATYPVKYDYMSCYPVLVNNELEFQNRIQKFFNEVVRDALKDFETYIIDFWVGEKSILIIELNSFESWTGACLFSWAENSKQLMHGPFEFRIVREPQQSDLTYLIPTEWRKHLERELEGWKPSSACVLL